ncbi:MAG TPA: hypothetical protein VMG36_07470 [Thermoplasmata archaeon]|nr:hypothetical protein [Thermoplasmata archaeon]
MPEVVDLAAELPVGSHTLSLHASNREAKQHAVSFLAGTPPGQAASYWIGDGDQLPDYRAQLTAEAPEHVGCVAVLPHEQVTEQPDGHLRPAGEIQEFLHAHPEGISAGGDTLSLYWTDRTIPAHLEYEAWLSGQPYDRSRLLCPYDLRRVPPSEAPRVLRELGAHHSHVVLSGSGQPAVRLLQLFVFPDAARMPSALRETLDWGLKTGLVRLDATGRDLSLTTAGEEIVAEWSQQTTVDW